MKIDYEITIPAEYSENGESYNIFLRDFLEKIKTEKAEYDDMIDDMQRQIDELTLKLQESEENESNLIHLIGPYKYNGLNRLDFY